MSDAPCEVLAGVGLEVRHRGRAILTVERLGLVEGEILAVLGPNGAGKSTLLRVLALLERPASGRVIYRGASGSEAEAALRRASASVFQRPHLWAGSVRDNLELGLRLAGSSGRARRAKAEEAARQLGIDSLLDADARALSGGEAQRLALARALVLDPDVLFLDEPTANLDADVRRSLREDLERTARARARSILLATHDRAEALSLADRIAVLRGGRIVQVGRPAELYENPADPYIAEVTGAEFSLRGKVIRATDGVLEVEVATVVLRAVGSAGPGERVRLAYRPEDLLLSREAVETSSARNRIRGVVRDVREVGGLLRVRLEGPPELVAVITRASGAELELAPGSGVHVSLKATALHAFPV